MPIDWDHTNQCCSLINRHFLYSFYDGLNVLSKKTCWIQLSAPLVGVVDGVVSVAILA